jgi:hypothetical protein
LELSPASSRLSLHVTDQNRRPIVGAQARVYGSPLFEGLVIPGDESGGYQTNEHGDLSMRGLPAGEHLIIVEAKGLAPATAAVTLGDEPADLSLSMQHGCEVTLNARLVNGAAIRTGQLVVRDAERAPIYHTLESRLNQEIGLTNRKLLLAPGKYSVECYVPGEYRGVVTFDASPGALVEVVLEPVDR